MLKIYDEFLEDETILALKDRSYRLHVSALVYCSRNLTNGEVTDRAVKVLQAILGFPAKRHVDELVAAGLWERIDDGYQIRNYLEFNPSAEIVKAEKSKARDRMRKLREKRAGGEEPAELSGARSPERNAERALQPHTRPYQALDLASIPGRNSETLGPELADAIDRARTATEHQESLPVEIEFQVARLLRRIGAHADEGTRHVIASYARKLPQASLAKVIESLENSQPKDRAAYAVGALRDELTERNAA